MTNAASLLDNRLKHLESHLERENPVLLSTVQSFRRLDQVAHRMGLLPGGKSFATQIPWWPLVAVLGTFSAGKSTFINHYLGSKLQRSGNQAVDDKFTVICYSDQATPHALPGVALDSDPRFPFYKISGEIEKVAAGEGRRIDAYLQLKACPSQRLKGKIIIDSPGFDADAQRTSTLRITDHIIDLSDLVIVLFDARHPEPGAMRDTLTHLVGNTIHRADAGKFLYVLNQIDTTAREDNPEDVIAAWQRALGEQGLTAGRFYTIYSPEAAIPIENPTLRERFEHKRDQDLGEIHARMAQVEIERAYRIVGALEDTAREIQERVVPLLQRGLNRWRRATLISDGVLAVLLLSLFLIASISAGHWQGLQFQAPWWLWVTEVPWRLLTFWLLLLAALGGIHFGMRRLMASLQPRWLKRQAKESGIKTDVESAFQRSTRFWRSLFHRRPAGWGRRSQREIATTLQEVDDYVQSLNDRFTNPSGSERLDLAIGPAGTPPLGPTTVNAAAMPD